MATAFQLLSRLNLVQTNKSIPHLYLPILSRSTMPHLSIYQASMLSKGQANYEYFHHQHKKYLYPKQSLSDYILEGYTMQDD